MNSPPFTVCVCVNQAFVLIITGYPSLHQMCHWSASKTASGQSSSEDPVMLGPQCPGKPTHHSLPEEIAGHVSSCEAYGRGESWFSSWNIQVCVIVRRCHSCIWCYFMTWEKNFRLRCYTCTHTLYPVQPIIDTYQMSLYSLCVFSIVLAELPFHLMIFLVCQCWCFCLKLLLMIAINITFSFSQSSNSYRSDNGDN